MEAVYNDFEKWIIKNDNTQQDPKYAGKDGNRYAIITRTGPQFCNEMNRTTHTMQAWQTKRSSSTVLDAPSLVQKYIYPKGNRACITRMVYKTKNNPGDTGTLAKSSQAKREKKSLCASHAYKIRNLKDLDDPKEKQVNNKATQCSNRDNMNSFYVDDVSGGALAPYEIIAERVVEFCQMAFKVRILEIVLDFISEERTGRNYQFNMKHIKLDTLLYKDVEDITRDEKKKTLDEKSSSVYCKLCLGFFKKDEASKTLTYKLLWEFSQHLKKRGKYFPDLDVSHCNTRPCRVCDQCYMVVVSEHELIELEQQFAKAQNIPIKDPYLRVPIEKKAKHRPASPSSTTRQKIFFLNINFIKK